MSGDRRVSMVILDENESELDLRLSSSAGGEFLLRLRESEEMRFFSKDHEAFEKAIVEQGIEFKEICDSAEDP